jgi:hypothetical protein
MVAMLTLIALAAAQIGAGGDRTPDVWIEQSDRGGGVIELLAFARSDHDMTAAFALDVQRGGTNVSRSRQSGQVHLNAGEIHRLSRLAIGPVHSPSDWAARLELSVDGEVVASAGAPTEPR